MEDIDNELIISSRSGTTTAIIGSLSGVNLSGDIDDDEEDNDQDNSKFFFVFCFFIYYELKFNDIRVE